MKNTIPPKSGFLLGWLFLVPLFLFSTNVRDFDARGDGITDDTRAIQLALQASDDGELFFPTGKYRITESILVDLQQIGPVMIRGVGGGSTILMEGIGAAFVVRGSHRGSALPSSVHERVWEKEKYFVIESLEILGGHDDADGVQMIELMQPVIRHCLFRDLRYGIHLVVRNRNVILQGNHIFHCRKYGIFLDEVNLHQINIHDNHISYCSQGGIVVRNSEIRNIQIVGNDIEYNFDRESDVPCADIYFDVEEKGSVREGTISGNNIQAERSSGGATIHFLGYPEDRLRIGLISISGNHISNQETLLKLRNVRGISITGNTMIRGYEYHIDVEDAENIVIQGNVVDHNPDYFRGNDDHRGGLRISRSRDVMIVGNIIEGVSRGSKTAGGALEIGRSSRITVQANHLVSCRHRGITVSQSDAVTIADCTITPGEDRLTDGILIEGQCDSLVLRDNRIGAWTRAKVYR